ncbi:transporter [Massilia sp. CFBP9012]|uniref:transporter n=1 Tax=Massilia sp. CFBP9012 TaxID=3096531 RepID=UPI002A6A62DD|nr:transporter [Massilia sp. CFBP9012]MDY0977455.1 transporter [Massilia sp. CFBP9012]
MAANTRHAWAAAAGLARLCCQPVHAQDAQELAKKLANPVAAMISVPLQANDDRRYGPTRDGHRFTLNVQPVVPVTLNPDWTLISRTILPVISQHELTPGAGHQHGIGDVTQSLFISPSRPGANGIVWGAGPAFLLPTGSESTLSARQWGAGPTGVVLRQHGPWTYGALANHIWSFAGHDDRPNVSATFLQPFLSYTTRDAWTFGINTESSYDWKQEQWSVPVNFTASKLLRFGRQPVSIGGGLRYWADSPGGGPRDWGVRLSVTFLFAR